MADDDRLTIYPKRLALGAVRLLELNARYMRHETFRTLVENIRRDGALTSAPFAVWDTDAYLVLSGNHRVKAAIEALGADHETEFLVTDEELPAARRTAIQLSHNAIAGEDDPAILSQLYEQLDAIEWRTYSGLDDAQLRLLAADDTMPLTAPNLDYQPLTVIFLPGEIESAEKAWKEAAKLASGNPKWLARLADYDRTLAALAAAGRAYDTHNVATALLLVLEVFERHRTDLAAGFLDAEGEATHEGWVPLAAILGGDTVPASSAAILRRAIARMVDEGHVTPHNLVGALELWAADFLAGPIDTP